VSKVIKLPIKNAGKFDLKPVVKLRKTDSSDQGQLNIFEVEREGRVVDLHRDSGFFDSALRVHEKDPDKAREMYTKAIAQGDHVSDAYCNLAIIESQLGNIAKAIDAFTRSLESDPRHFESHYNVANIYADAGNHELAVVHYEVAREINPTDPNIHYNLALVLALCERYDEALKSLDTYFKLSESGNSDEDAQKLKALLRTSSRSAN